MPPKDKVYVGFIRSKPDKFGEVLDMGLTLKDLDTLRGLVDDRGWVNIKIRARREHGPKGQTHYACWMPPGTLPRKSSAPTPPAPTTPPPRKGDTAQDTQGELAGIGSDINDIPF